MDRAELFDRNLLVLHGKSPELCTKLSSSETTRGYYKLMYSKNNLPVPALQRLDGSLQPLHSLFDPYKEAERIIKTVEKAGYLIIMGLGGGYFAKEALKRPDIQSVLIIDFNLNACAELFSLIDYVSLLSDPRISLLVEPSAELIYHYLLETYKPALHGGIQVISLRPRVDYDPEPFTEASDMIRVSIETISEDYSVQAYFGKPWFSNTVRNIINSEKHVHPFVMPQNVAITAAGPSLELQIQDIKRDRNESFLLATDTSLPALLEHGIEPDGVISIDCQHISYYHFVPGKPKHIPLFLDLSSPPVLANLSDNTYFFSGGHPFTQYISHYWRSFPFVDTSGGNVTFAAVALADQLGARKITLYGVDFSYPEGESYARGTYIHKLFYNKQDRLHPAEAMFSGFLFRNSQLLKISNATTWRYETKPLINYRKKLEALSERIQAQLVISEGKGAPISVHHNVQKLNLSKIKPVFTVGAVSASAKEFLYSYVECIMGLPLCETSLPQYIQQLSEYQRDIFTTLIPLAAFIRRTHQDIPLYRLIEILKEIASQEINRFLSSISR
ncbi:motility associated factor glycosyltransferase family protein [Gracilinema caldarium]|uniref:6-hydroxymethylpterin diphosphokinase MptE-like domain-containing protein n=1 Tax=Gracilinema caldarium (strain ATCC 51460 / DSM 7334 / H1) TaxID=744872 RepID=F8F2P4_GRAC1|nr:6-hydroxymethylpterin diphosphokinase MptE-like protein [Gracilinema caldarium]AEJ19438.1 protein of unknown function DUF115 [Gracilinema caldarium DSM 7334]